MTYETHLFKLLERAADPMKTNDPIDHVTFDIPLLIRVFELVREDIKTDKDLHDVVERIISLKNRGVVGSHVCLGMRKPPFGGWFW